ncbi:hypothetical protein HUN41_00043 [Streptomyces phage Coruscant]|uniref:Uncharacterized protein n=1 Tax=Streptomyces phage Coruscant TaxID=2739834 RepID=A0A7G4AVY2_9CAUD|nr:hypothetical protein PP454_gp245 [Streptomyces phage Coruscant]QMP84172.1 hypothetical protein HUN41_00043 [Streptomyces phage Coruscant]
MFQESRFYLTYELDGIKKETTELLPRNSATVEKQILEEEGATNVKIVKYQSRLV